MELWHLTCLLLLVSWPAGESKHKKPAASYGKPKPSKAPITRRPSPPPVAEPAPLPEPQPDFCFGKKDGDYALEKCSAKYVSCVGYSSVSRECQGGLVFDSVHNDCTHQLKSVDCTGQQRAPPAAPAPAPAPADQPSAPEFDCAGQDNGFYANPAKACDVVYYACSGGRSSQLVCSGNLNFDPELKICDVYANVPVCSGSPRTSPLPITPFVPAEQPAPPAVPAPALVDFDCSALEDGNYARGCSGSYFACVGRQAHLRECPLNFVYDVALDQCEQREFVEACGGKPRAPVQPEAVIEKVPSSVFDCSALEDGFYVNPAAKCSATYYACSGKQAEKLQCPEGLAFEPESLSCQPTDAAFICTGVRPVAAEATPAPTPGPTFPPVPFDCAGKQDGPHANPTDKCSKLFFICSNGIATQEQCAADSVFDAEKKACNLFENVFACTGLPPPAPVVFVQEEWKIPESADLDCRQLANGLYPNHKEACSQEYYVCSNGISFVKRCLKSLFFDPDLKVCQVFDFVFVCSGQRPTTYVPMEQELFVNTPAPQKAKLFDCSDLPDGQYPNPGQKCSNFYHVCSNKQDDLMYCPGDLFFSPEDKVCARFVEIESCSGLPPSVPDVPAQLPSDFAPLPSVPFDCSGKPDGDYPSPSQPCDHIYFSCVDQQARLHECQASNLFFDDKLDLCAPKDEVPACGGSPKVFEPILPQPEPEAVPFDCSRLDDGHYSAEDCASFYYSCVGKKASRSECAAGLKFDPKTLICDFAEFVVSCGGAPRPAVVAEQPSEPQVEPEPEPTVAPRPSPRPRLALKAAPVRKSEPKRNSKPKPKPQAASEPAQAEYGRQKRAASFYRFGGEQPVTVAATPKPKPTRARYAFRTRPVKTTQPPVSEEPATVAPVASRRPPVRIYRPVVSTLAPPAKYRPVVSTLATRAIYRPVVSTVAPPATVKPSPRPTRRPKPKSTAAVAEEASPSPRPRPTARPIYGRPSKAPTVAEPPVVKPSTVVPASPSPRHPYGAAKAAPAADEVAAEDDVAVSDDQPFLAAAAPADDAQVNAQDDDVAFEDDAAAVAADDE